MSHAPENAICMGTDEEKRTRVRAQFNELKGENNAMVTCGCGRNIPVRFAFQCLYCREWFCQADAEAHFGKTLREYQEEQAATITAEGGCEDARAD